MESYLGHDIESKETIIFLKNFHFDAEKVSSFLECRMFFFTVDQNCFVKNGLIYRSFKM